MIKQEFVQKDELGQVWTPSDVAYEMAKKALGAKPHARRVLDPACGPATFSVALRKAGAKGLELVCYDVDECMQQLTTRVNAKLRFKGETILADYLGDTNLENTFDIVIMNPPYIRQEDIKKTSKEIYHRYLSRSLKGEIDKRANLFALFLLKGLLDLKPDGVLCAIVYDAINQSVYGKKTLELISRHAEMLSSEHVKMPFDDVLVDAQVLLFRKRQHVLKTCEPVKEVFDDKLTTLENLIETRRGTAFPLRKLFLTNSSDPYFKSSDPIFIKQSSITGLVVKSDQRAYLANKPLHAKVLKWLYERANKQIPLARMSILGIKGPIVFNYYIRKAPRHLWNPDNVAVSDNFYVSIPKNNFPSEVAWLLLNSKVYLSKLCAAARNQGNGLLKLQLYEYKNARVPDWNLLPKQKIATLLSVAQTLINSRVGYAAVREIADRATRGLFHA